MSAAASRRKGVTGERECAGLWHGAGWTLRGLEGSGDWLAFTEKLRAGIYADLLVHLEIKRQERLRLPEWLKQAADEAPPGVPPVVCFRQNRGEWYAVLPLADLLEIIG